MTRSLLNTFPTWLLAIFAVGLTVAVSLAGLLLVRRFSKLRQRDSNDVVGVVIGVLAAVFGILLGFVTVSLYQDYTDAKATVRSETTDLVQLYSDSRAFTPAASAAMTKELRSYVAAVRFSEWQQMRDGKVDALAGDERVAGLYRALQTYEPETKRAATFYADALARLDDVVDARSARITVASGEMPGGLRIVLLLGAGLLIVSLYALATSSRRLHAMLVVSVAVLVSLNLLVVAALEHPFSGDLAISNAPFDQQQLKLLHVTRADLRGP